MMRVVRAVVVSSVLLCCPLAEGAEKLSLVIGLEKGLEASLPKECKRPKLFFKTEDSQRTKYIDHVRTQVGEMSTAIFGNSTTIEATFVEFTLQDLSNHLEAYIAGSGTDRDLPYQLDPWKEKPKKATAYRKMIDDIREADAFRLRLDRKYSNTTVGQRCNQTPESALNGDQSLGFLREMWQQESMRQVHLKDYLSLVFFYLRDKHGAGRGDVESLAPVLVHPTGLWTPASSNDAEIKATNVLISKASRASGTAQTTLIPLIREKINDNLNGRTYYSRVDATRPDIYKSTVRKRRQGFIAGNWLTFPASSQRTLYHELSHYLGIAHVFTNDDTTYTNCKKKFSFGTSFWTVWNAKETTTEVRHLLCDCFFLKRNDADFFADFDGSIAGTGDTPLAIMHGKSVKYPVCKSETYSKQFPAGSRDAQENLMTYIPGRPNEWTHFAVLTAGQKKVAADLLKSFD